MAGSEADFWAKVQKDDGCWLWMGRIGRGGYGEAYFKGQGRSAHRLSYELAVGEIPPGKWVLHHCDVPLCVRPDHLYAGTVVDNVRDSVVRKRNAFGSRNGNALLTEAQITDIKQLARAGWLHREIAKKYGVDRAQISHIVIGRAWRHVDPDVIVPGRRSHKLTAETAREIVSLYASGKLSHRAIARKLDIHPSLVGRILSGEVWSHATGIGGA